MCFYWGILSSFNMIGPFILSFDASTCCAVLALALTLLMSLRIHGRPKNLPPLPGVALPFIGHTYLLKKNPRRQIKQWADKHDVFTLQMGSQNNVFINSLEAMKEAFIKKADCFSDRNEYFFLARHFSHATKGLIFSSGDNWKSQRSHSLSILRKFGMGKNTLAEKIMEEVSCFTEELARKNGQPSDIGHLTYASVSNVICSLIYGRRFEFDDPKFIQMMQILNELTRCNIGTSILNVIPELFYLPIDIFQGKAIINAYSQLREFTRQMIAKIRSEFEGNSLANYISAYSDAMRKELHSLQTTYLDEINLARNIEELFLGGTETTSATILWCLLYALNFPDVQKKIFNDIANYVGTERLPNIDDKPKLKYLTAFIMEVQRISSIVPLSIPHLCNADSTVAGYFIPKGSVVMPNLDAVLRSKEIWGDPETFRPERFLDEQGDIIRREEFIPFSIGRRRCLGESLAKMELFLYLSTLFQRFEFVPASPDKFPHLNDTFGGVAAPESFEIRCVERTI
ncbi:cytochrome P450 2 sub U member 1 [Bulinus truncatus]|nr:cytochrome P450 2 sub U member 1 [Bulinus truncatus]